MSHTPRTPLRAAALTALLLLCCPAAFAASEGPLTTFIQYHYAETLALIPTVALLVMLFFSVSIDPYINAGQRRTMRIILVTVLSLVAQNYLEYLLIVGPGNRFVRTVVAIYGYVVRPMIIALYLRLLRQRDNYTWVRVLVIINTLVYATALFTPLCFSISEDNAFTRGPLNFTCLYISIVLLIGTAVITIKEFHPRLRDTWVPMIAYAMLAAGVYLDGNVHDFAQPVSYLTIAIVLSCEAYYSWLHLRFAREHEDAMRAGQRLQLMLSQIKPHFLYNAQSAIEALCVIDPKSARMATAKFSQYLRGNLELSGDNALIPFEKELSHTRLYLELEQLRFGEDLEVRYDIKCQDFKIPTLTLEPLAENAVRHGIRETEEGRGTVSISAYETREQYVITVIDDGAGFDVDALTQLDANHVGIRNVRERLKRVSDGTLEITSGEGKGTTATIRIPKDGEAAPC